MFTCGLLYSTSTLLIVIKILNLKPSLYFVKNVYFLNCNSLVLKWLKNPDVSMVYKHLDKWCESKAVDNISSQMESYLCGRTSATPVTWEVPEASKYLLATRTWLATTPAKWPVMQRRHWMLTHEHSPLHGIQPFLALALFWKAFFV